MDGQYDINEWNVELKVNSIRKSPSIFRQGLLCYSVVIGGIVSHPQTHPMHTRVPPENVNLQRQKNHGL